MPACDRRCSKAQETKAGGRQAVLFLEKKNQKDFITLGRGLWRRDCHHTGNLDCLWLIYHIYFDSQNQGIAGNVPEPSLPKPVIWIASSKDDISAMPDPVKASFGHRLREVQLGRTPLDTKPLRNSAPARLSCGSASTATPSA